MIDSKVALTSTLTVFETFTPGRPMPPGVEVLVAPLRDQFTQTFERKSKNQTSNYLQLFPKMMQLERAFARAGGMLIAGTDPTGSGGVIPGYSNQRQLELLVEAGFTPLEAITIGTLNGAKYMGRDKQHRLHRRGQAGRSGADFRRSVHGHCRRAQCGHGIPPGRRIRSREVDTVSHRPRRTLVTRPAAFDPDELIGDLLNCF